MTNIQGWKKKLIKKDLFHFNLVDAKHEEWLAIEWQNIFSLNEYTPLI